MERRDKKEGNDGMKGKTKGRKEKRMEGRKEGRRQLLPITTKPTEKEKT